MLEDVLKFCGYDNAFDLINYHYSEEDMVHLMMDLVNSPEDAVDFIKETVENLAYDYYEWVDLDEMKAQAEGMAYAKYRDGE